MAEEKEAPRKVSRRQFVKGAAAVAGVGALASCAPPATPAPGETAAPAPTCPPAGECAPCPVPGVPETWDKEADVVVVGFGGAGGSAAMEAHDAGAKVIILEKTSTPGGSTVLCGGKIYAAGTSIQQEFGITDTADEMYEYWMGMGKGLSDPALVRILADKSLETFDWLKSMGVEWHPGYNSASPQVASDESGLYFSGAEADPWAVAITPAKPRGHYAKPVEPTWPYPPKHATSPALQLPWGLGSAGTAYFRPLYEGVTERGIEVLLETRATALVTNPLTNEVLGVKAESNGQTLYIKANRAVALTTGSFEMNKEMAQLYCPEALTADYTASDTGDGILMGMAIGAAVVNMDQTAFDVSIPAGSIMVNQGARRFVDETLYRVKGEAWIGQVDSLAFAIFDEDIKTEAKVAETIQAPTIGELAEKIGIDPTVLEATVNAYNGYAESGKDLEFGRTTKRHHAEAIAMVPIKTPPFHAVKKDGNAISGSIGGNIPLGGIRYNAKAQVMDVNGQVIPRLYAAGRTCGGALGAMYPASGSAILECLAFGRILGANAAVEEPWQ